ncbi:E3 ubiquitin-protein ligase RNF169 isoform X2 [Oreochromis niloticus]|uniref:E3 ubiquitin-protein ligase RNF169 isoform X2 n=1 Tax=Oreochromis niloticus TaxID=8128 RepID=UPI000904BC4F|nr:E3 ubiquitin-protein ligase RNF169 isoform X2 [Oreochromis niloticus]
MATAGSAERPGRPASATAAGTSRAGLAARCRSGSSPPEYESKKCTACAEPGGSPTGGHLACLLCLARRHSGSEERLRGRSDHESSSSRPGRRDCDSRREFFVSPALIPKSADAPSGPSGKHKLLLCDDREEVKRKSSLNCKDESVRRDEDPGVLSDSENEEPISRRIRNISAFIRKTKNSSAGSCQRSRSCTDPVEDGGGKMKVVTQPAAVMDRVCETVVSRDQDSICWHQPQLCGRNPPLL